MIAALERSVAIGEQMREWQAALREGKKLPVSENPPDWPSLKARLAALLTIDEDTRKLLEEAARIRNQTSQE